MTKINWDDKNSKISKYFTVHEATFLPSWGVHHIPSEEEKKNIISMAKTADLVRHFLGKPMIVHCWIRPTIVNPDSTIIIKPEDLTNPKKLKAYNTLNYNEYVGSITPNGGHPKGLAIDFNVMGYETAEGCKEIREKLLTKLEEYDIRMENRDGSWIHIDKLPVIHNRFFRP